MRITVNCSDSARGCGALWMMMMMMCMMRIMRMRITVNCSDSARGCGALWMMMMMMICMMRIMGMRITVNCYVKKQENFGEHLLSEDDHSYWVPPYWNITKEFFSFG